MGNLGLYVERSTISNSHEMGSLMRFAQVAQRLGHRTDFLFRPDMYKIPDCNALFIRAATDPLNSAYVAARTAQMHNIPVLDDPDSIYICCDKVNMYHHLRRAGVSMPETEFVSEAEVTAVHGKDLFERLGNPLVLKAPHSSFSLYVERAKTVEEYLSIGKRFMRRADRIIAQRFVPSQFDWRVGILGNRPLYVCQYTIPKKRWKILTYMPTGPAIQGPVKSMSLAEADPHLLERALQAAAAIGEGLYGVDLKQVGDDYIVIEVNDNPTIIAGDEDKKAPDVYEKIIRFLMES
ncbi:MAG: RimK family alpha-L-glutamate ligase [Candidatus Eisenbacteria bacterium]|uniref:RimK family alpha-L-glutamate ligase n=1 Tax=Eiseniibacteriota bacterium TaxID=2212470 RepID=A0A948W3J4_UNCEI|nr:RimK family alpha-L-glutamate ligase [Candidatus Eisenbacteria bacterium]MBU1950497.1 RimK family alpha-L-glutamate ligase [Candidatus Eisenbacteria bacterium]MBU2691162.1 RimK family alpha-L-glutamate ligase [Candidatus Eisenbacteria bacterium]